MGLRTPNKGGLTQSSDERGVSEIVGALMLVAVVSSAAFGFGMFIHQQSKETQAQKALEQARALEKLEVSSVLPEALPFDGLCPGIVDDDSWHSLTFTVASRHLRETALTAMRLNHVPVLTAQMVGPTRSIPDAMLDGSDVVLSPSNQFRATDVGLDLAGTGIPVGSYIESFTDAGTVTLNQNTLGVFGPVTTVVGGLTHDFSRDVQSDPAAPDYNPRLRIEPRQTVQVVLHNVAMDPGAPCTPGSTWPYGLVGGPPAATAPGPIKLTDALHPELVTERGNNVERVFVPPTASATLEPVAVPAGTYVLIGTGSAGGAEGSFIVKWTWEYWNAAACGAPGSGTPATASHRSQVSGLNVGTQYCVRLSVSDNNGLSSSAQVVFTA